MVELSQTMYCVAWSFLIEHRLCCVVLSDRKGPVGLHIICVVWSFQIDNVDGTDDELNGAALQGAEKADK